jgi:hypothetical protein
VYSVQLRCADPELHVVVVIDELELIPVSGFGNPTTVFVVL